MLIIFVYISAPVLPPFSHPLFTSPTMASALPNRPHQAAVALDFLVVGGSSAGLSAAYALRRVGHRVLVLEQNQDFIDVRSSLSSPSPAF